CGAHRSKYDPRWVRRFRGPLRASVWRRRPGPGMTAAPASLLIFGTPEGPGGRIRGEEHAMSVAEAAPIPSLVEQLAGRYRRATANVPALLLDVDALETLARDVWALSGRPDVDLARRPVLSALRRAVEGELARCRALAAGDPATLDAELARGRAA